MIEDLLSRIRHNILANYSVHENTSDQNNMAINCVPKNTTNQNYPDNNSMADTEYTLY